MRARHLVGAGHDVTLVARRGVHEEKILLASLACATALAAPTAAHAEDPPLVSWSDLLPGLTTNHRLSGGKVRTMLQLPDGVRGCLFDLDGVLTQTAKIHAQASSQAEMASMRPKVTSRVSGDADRNLV